VSQGPEGEAFVRIRPSDATFSQELEAALAGALRNVAARLSAQESAFFSPLARAAQHAAQSIEASLSHIGVGQVGGDPFSQVVANARRDAADVNAAFEGVTFDPTVGGDPFAPAVVAAQRDAADINTAFQGGIGGGIETSVAQAESSLAGLQSFAQQTAMGIAQGVGQQIFTSITETGKQLLQFGIDSAGAFEQTHIALDSLAKNGDKFFTDLQQFAAATPFEFEDLTNLAERLLTIPQIGQEGVLPTLTKIGDLGAVLAVPAQQLQGVVVALQRISGQGRATLGDFQLLTDNLPGFNAAAAIANSMGLSTAEVMKQLRGGGIDADTAIRGLIEGMGNFPGAAGHMAVQSQSLIGLMSTMHDTMQMALTSSLQPLVTVLKDAIPGAVAVAGPTLEAFGTSVSRVAASLLPAIEGFVGAAGPSLTSGIGSIFEGIARSAGTFLTEIQPTAIRFGAVLESIAPSVEKLLDALGQVGQGYASTFVTTLEVLNPLLGAFASIINAIPTPILNMVGTLLALDRIGGGLGFTMSGLGGAVRNAESAFKNLAAHGASSMQAMQGAASSFMSSFNVGMTVAMIGIGIAMQQWADDEAKVAEINNAAKQTVNSLSSALSEVIPKFQAVATAQADGGATTAAQTGILDVYTKKLQEAADSNTEFKYAIDGMRGTSNVGDMLRTAGTDAQGFTAALRAGAGALKDGQASTDQFFDGFQNKVLFEEYGKSLLSTNDILREYAEQQQRGAQAAITAAVSTGKFTEAQVAEATAIFTNNKGYTNYIGVLDDLTKKQVEAANVGGQKQLDQIAGTGKVTQAQVQQAIEQTKLKDGTLDLSAAAALLNDNLTMQEKTAKAAAQAFQGHRAALGGAADVIAMVRNGTSDLNSQLTGLATGLNNAKLSDDQWKASAENLGVSVDSLKGFVTEVTKAVDGYVSSISSSLPGLAGVVKDSIDDASKAFNLDTFSQKLQEQTQNMLDFQQNIRILLFSGLTNLAQIAATQGPQVAAGLVQPVKDGNLEIAHHLDDQVKLFNTAHDNVMNDARGWGATFAAQNGDTARAAVANFGANFDLQTIIGTQLTASTGLAADSAVGLGGSITDGVATGMQKEENIQRVRDAANAIIQAAENPLLNHFGIESPSKLMAQYGHFLVQGLAIGMTNSAHLAASASRAMAAGVANASAIATGVARNPAIDEMLSGGSASRPASPSAALMAGPAAAGGDSVVIKVDARGATERDAWAVGRATATEWRSSKWRFG
jgi:tape measure domain-containing protein